MSVWRRPRLLLVEDRLRNRSVRPVQMPVSSVRKHATNFRTTDTCLSVLKRAENAKKRAEKCWHKVEAYCRCSRLRREPNRAAPIDKTINPTATKPHAIT